MDDRRRPSVSLVERAWHLLFSVCVGVGLIPWLLASLVLWAFRCDENCGAGDYDNWQYTGQLILAAVGALLAVAAVVLGFSAARIAYRRTALAAIGTALLWIGWVSSGTF